MDQETLELVKNLQPIFAKAMGPIRLWEDLLYYPETDKIHTFDTWENSAFLRMPIAMPFPGQDEKRTLWGMVDWNRFHEFQIDALGRIGVGGWFWIDPYLALLKIIEAQREEGVKGGSE